MSIERKFSEQVANPQDVTFTPMESNMQTISFPNTNSYNSASRYYQGGITNNSITDVILNTKTPIDVNETALITVRINGQEITGIWVNKEECLNWRGMIPLEKYRINTEGETILVKKQVTYTQEQTQNIAVKYIKPPPLPPAGDINIRQEPDVQIPAGPPIIVRKLAATLQAPPTLFYREKPPAAPLPVPSVDISVPGRIIDPPPRQIIVERMAAQASMPQDIHIERWLGYDKQKRNVVFHQAAQIQQAVPAKNMVIDWEANDKTRINQNIKFLGVETIDPIDYENKYRSELVEAQHLPSIAKQINNQVSNEVLATNVNLHEQREFILTGDVEALKLVEKNKNINLNSLLLAKY